MMLWRATLLYWMSTLERAQPWVSFDFLRTCSPSDLEYERSLKRTTIEIVVDMAAWFGKALPYFLPLLLRVRCLSGYQRPFPCWAHLLVAESIHKCQVSRCQVDSSTLFFQELMTRKTWTSIRCEFWSGARALGQQSPTNLCVHGNGIET